MQWTDPEVFGYARRIAHKNAWRFYGQLDEDDLLQEFAIAFLYVKRRADPARGPAAFMALFKQKLKYTLLDLSRRYLGTLHCGESIQASTIEGPTRRKVCFTDLLGKGHAHSLQEVDLGFVIQDAPEPIRIFLEAKLSGTLKQPLPDGKLESTRDAITRLTGIRATTFYRLLRAWGEAEFSLAPA